MRKAPYTVIYLCTFVCVGVDTWACYIFPSNIAIASARSSTSQSTNYLVCSCPCIIFQFAVYGFGSDTFTRPEAQFPYDVPLAYFKGPSNAQLRMAIDYNGEGTGNVIVIEIDNGCLCCLIPH